MGTKEDGLQSYIDLEEEVKRLKNELTLTCQAEENGKKALDDLAFALKEVALEANQTQVKLILAQEELDRYKRESEELKGNLKISLDAQRALLEEAERLKMEAEESASAWEVKETEFVNCIKRTEEEKEALLEDNAKLLESTMECEATTKAAKQDCQHLRDILRQALAESNAARAENAQLKGALESKEEALQDIIRENEGLRITELAAMETINQLKSKLPGKERRLGNSLSFNLKDLVIPVRSRSSGESEKRGTEEDDAPFDPLKGSIFDTPETPSMQRKIGVSHVIFEGDKGLMLDGFEHDDRLTKRKKLLRRFGEMITKSLHKKEPMPNESPRKLF